MTKETVTVHIRYMDSEQTFTGNVDQVWVGVNRFFSKMIPALQIVKKIHLTVDLEKLVENCKNVIAVTHEGPILLVSKQKLTDSETLTLNLLATYIGSKLGLSKSYLSKEELRAELGKNAKIASTRLGELCREGYAKKTEQGHYRITTLGIRRFQEDILPKIRK